jgi:hypothetical protein
VFLRTGSYIEARPSQPPKSAPQKAERGRDSKVMNWFLCGQVEARNAGLSFFIFFIFF